ncbi:Potassium channel KOR2 [Apostasia shenzhenica]|uniref:Potassium channel n=1 Tax=Apostasia shenzhenica TaxID=1088818 RepID=A0A2I0ANU1_9ASPA|nr:Potassium channel KOR2 [Apostasia shenzhenica]
MRKINQFFKKTEKDIRVSYLFSRIVKLIAIQLYSVHVAACIFYYLATTVPAEREGHTWIGSLTLGDQSYINFRNLGFSRRYVTSLYYAIVTMATIGYGDIHAVNTMEMIFVIIYVVFNTILGAYVIGNMSAMIVKGSKTERFRDEMANLTQFMHMHNLSKETRNQIKSHLILQYDHGHPRVCLLEDFPVAVKSKVFLSLYFETVQKVPLFKGCSKKFLNQIAINLKEELFLSGEVILEQGTVVDHIYIISQGFLNEVLIGEDGSEVLISELMPNDLFGEVAALCNILQPYTVRACKPCRLLRLQKQALHTILQLHAEENRNLLINLSEGKHTELGKKILVSEMNHHATKRDSELALGLKHAAYRGDLYSLEDLVNAGADINEKDYDGRTSLHIAASRGHEDIVRFLLGQKVEVNCIDHIGNSPLMEAVKAGHEGVVKLLQENGAILELEDPGSYLCKLAADNNVDVLRRLLQYGVDANCQNYDQRTPLHVAAAKGQLIVVLILIEFGADVVAKDRWGNTPIDEGHRCGNKPLIEILNHARENRK